MAVVNAYVDANLAATPPKLGSAALVSGAASFTVVQAWQIAAADSASSVYRVFKGIPSDAIITSLEVLNDAVAGATAGLVGLYNVLDFDGVGAIIGSGNQLNASFAFSSANAIASGWANLLTAVSIANKEKQLWELASQTQAPGTAGPKASAYDICVTMVGMTTNTANIALKMSYIRGV